MGAVSKLPQDTKSPTLRSLSPTDSSPTAQSSSKPCSRALEQADEAWFYNRSLAERSPPGLGTATGISTARSLLRAGVTQKWVVKSVSLTRPQTSRCHLPSAVLPHPLCRHLPDNAGTQLSSGPLERVWGTPAQPGPNPAMGSAEFLLGGDICKPSAVAWQQQEQHPWGVWTPQHCPKGSQGDARRVKPRPPLHVRQGEAASSENREEDEQQVRCRWMELVRRMTYPEGWRHLW